MLVNAVFKWISKAVIGLEFQIAVPLITYVQPPVLTKTKNIYGCIYVMFTFVHEIL